MYKIGITGGIGSGKSVISNILRNLGYNVYDSDSEAKRLMCTDDNIISALTARFGKEIFTPERQINRILLADKIFRDKENLMFVNGTVHPAVCQDFAVWATGKQFAFIESAILFEAKLDSYVDKIIYVKAPLDLRIKRVTNRDHTTEEKVKERIANQQASLDYAEQHSHYIINNDGISELKPQIIKILDDIKSKP